jgi:steroid 5-alpha reductase family enzyme
MKRRYRLLLLLLLLLLHPLRLRLHLRLEIRRGVDSRHRATNLHWRPTFQSRHSAAVNDRQLGKLPLLQLSKHLALQNLSREGKRKGG